ncbi:MAG: patatin-like phospholipase family protein [Jatrophihabitantaceae bacterium]
MSDAASRGRQGGAQRPRRAIVLGAGGVLGFAWTLGALSALESVAGFDVRDVDLVIGTSAGSVAAALLGCGLPVDALCRHHQGVPVPEDPPIAYDYAGTGAALPRRPRMRPASPRLVLDALRHPRRTPPMVALSGLLPSGRGSLKPVHDLVAEVAEGAGFGQTWPDAPRPWIVASDYRAGTRVVFGRDNFAARRDGAPRVVRRAGLADAVTASCSIPAWYAPMVIDGVPYVDGGLMSNASVDVLQGTAVDEVFVLAPMASLAMDRPRSAIGRLERVVRRSITRSIMADVATLRATGVRACVLAPEVADLEIIGVNLMNPLRRTEVLETARETAAGQLRAQLAHDRPRRSAREKTSGSAPA